MAYTFTTEEKAIVTLCNGDLSKLEQAHKAGQLSFAAAMQAVQDASAAANAPKMSIKMQDTGTVTLTGINGKWGASYYPTQWKAISDKMPEILKFISDNQAELDRRGEATKAAKQAAKNAPPVAPSPATATPPVNAA